MYDSQVSMTRPSRRQPSAILRWGTEFALIFFSLYAVRLMAEFAQANGQGKSIGPALKDISSMPSFLIAMITSITGCIVLEFLIPRLPHK